MKEFNDKQNSLEELIKSSIDKVKVLMQTNTIVGEPISVSADITIIPISKASVGFVAGGGQISNKHAKKDVNDYPLTGGSGCGMSLTPTGFIVIEKSKVSFIDVENKSLYQTIINLLNKVVSKIKTEDNNNEKNEEKNENNG